MQNLTHVNELKQNQFSIKEKSHLDLEGLNFKFAKCVQFNLGKGVPFFCTFPF